MVLVKNVNGGMSMSMFFQSTVVIFQCVLPVMPTVMCHKDSGAGLPLEVCAHAALVRGWR